MDKTTTRERMKNVTADEFIRAHTRAKLDEMATVLEADISEHRVLAEQPGCGLDEFCVSADGGTPARFRHWLITRTASSTGRLASTAKSSPETI